MGMQEFVSAFIKILDIGAVYGVVQLVRCAILSYAVFAVVCLLRETVWKNHVFLKSALWSLFIPVLFTGRMKFFYENRIGIMVFTSWTGLCIRHVWICWMYLAGIFGYACLLYFKRRKLKKIVMHMEKKEVKEMPCVGGRTLWNRYSAVYIADFPVTPFASGIFRPRIVIPRVIWDQYEEMELQTILLHEKVHIRFGHLLYYFLWDVLRVLLWVNPLFTVCMKYLREDLEAVCDWVTIRKSGQDAYAYGKLLLKSLRVLQAEEKASSMYAAFADDEGYGKIRQRMEGIARYKPYRRAAAAGVPAAGILCALGLAAGIQSLSYGKNNEMDNLFIYDESGSMVQDHILHQMIVYDDHYVYVKREPFEELVKENHMGQQVFIVFGGYHKLPGIGGYGYSCQYGGGTKEKVVRIPYEKIEDQWVVKLYKLL